MAALRTGQVRFDTCRTLRLGSWFDFIRCFLTTIVNDCVLCAGSGYGGSSFRQFRSFEQSRKLSTKCRVCYSEQRVNAVRVTERSSETLSSVESSSSADSHVVASSTVDCKSVRCR